jgi:peptidoglycan/LPS O-acetylase OafA/YrhL
LVVLYHAGVPWLPGGFVGVDIFFVISGYLITSGIVRELRSNGRISLSGFYIRRMARILPAAAVTLTATVVLSWLLLPPTRWEQISRDAIGSGLYVVNWAFAGRSIDYLAQDQAPSPLQHFWSLAVEEQFYIVWPLLLIVIALICRRKGTALGKGLAAALALIIVPSLAWSVHLTAANPGGAYFVTTTRAWELGIGAGLAVVNIYGLRNTHARTRKVVGLAGAAAIVAAAISFNGATSFPGYVALLPVLGTAALLWSGEHIQQGALPFALSSRPMTWVGGISYSLYLWHWALLVIVAGVFGELSTIAGLGVVIVALIPAWLSTHHIEQPLQRWVRGFGGREGHEAPRLALGFGFTLAGLIPALLLGFSVPTSSAADPVGKIGAEQLAAGARINVLDSTEFLTPAAVDGAHDLPDANTNGCMLDHPTTAPTVCSYGDLDSGRVIALVGDSHAAMHIPGLDVVARDAGYRLDTYTKGSCPPVTVPIDFQGKHYEECGIWTANVTETLATQKPDLVLTAMSRAYLVHGAGLDEEHSRKPIAASLGDTWSQLKAAGVKVAAFRDVPKLGIVVPDCVAANPSSLSKCARPQSQALPKADQTILASHEHPDVAVIDLSASLCADGACPAVIHNVLVYRDSNHLTATYSRSLHGQLSEQVGPLLD